MHARHRLLGETPDWLKGMDFVSPVWIGSYVVPTACSVGVVLKFCAESSTPISGFPLYDPRMFPYSAADLSE